MTDSSLAVLQIETLDGDLLSALALADYYEELGNQVKANCCRSFWIALSATSSGNYALRVWNILSEFSKDFFVEENHYRSDVRRTYQSLFEDSVYTTVDKVGQDGQGSIIVEPRIIVDFHNEPFERRGRVYPNGHLSCFWILHHVNNKGEWMSNCDRILKPNSDLMARIRNNLNSVCRSAVTECDLL